jgi:tRNA A37 methylthiotransferase MiaB
MRNTHVEGGSELIGQIVNVEITSARNNSLIGKVLN